MIPLGLPMFLVKLVTFKLVSINSWMEGTATVFGQGTVSSNEAVVLEIFLSMRRAVVASLEVSVGEDEEILVVLESPDKLLKTASLSTVTIELKNLDLTFFSVLNFLTA